MDIKKLKSALQYALEKDFAIEFYNKNMFSICFNIYRLQDIYNAFIYIDSENGAINGRDFSINYQYAPQVKEFERIAKRLANALDGLRVDMLPKYLPVFEKYKDRSLQVYNAKYLIENNLYNYSEDI